MPEPYLRDYLTVTYRNKPYTEYPELLCKYLYHRFEMEPKQKLLDLGTGRCEYLREFGKLGLEVMGIDQAQSGKVMSPHLRFVWAEIERGMQFTAEAFDIIFAKSIFEHFYRPDKVMQDCYRMLKINGKLIALFPDWKRCYKGFYGDCGHHSPFTAESFRDLMDISGFDDIHVEVFYQVPLLWAKPYLKIPLQIVARMFPFLQNTTIRFSIQPMLLAWATKIRPNSLQDLSHGL